MKKLQKFKIKNFIYRQRITLLFAIFALANFAAPMPEVLQALAAMMLLAAAALALVIEQDHTESQRLRSRQADEVHKAMSNKITTLASIHYGDESATETKRMEDEITAQQQRQEVLRLLGGSNKAAGVYFQPDFGDGDALITPDGVKLWSYYVYASFDNATKDFPDRQIIAYKGDDIESPYFIDTDY